MRAARNCAATAPPSRCGRRPMRCCPTWLAHPGRVVGKNELLAAVWPGVVVNDESLSQCVRELRGALGDDEQVLIKTVPRRGYLFDVPVEAVSPPAATSAAPLAGRPKARWLKLGALLLAALALVVQRNDPPVDVDKGLKARRSVAVMPFVGVGAGDQSRVADAITAGLVTDLAKLPDTLIIDRVSAAQRTRDRHPPDRPRARRAPRADRQRPARRRQACASTRSSRRARTARSCGPSGSTMPTSATALGNATSARASPASWTGA